MRMTPRLSSVSQNYFTAHIHSYNPAYRHHAWPCVIQRSLTDNDSLLPLLSSRDSDSTRIQLPASHWPEVTSSPRPLSSHWCQSNPSSPKTTGGESIKHEISIPLHSARLPFYFNAPLSLYQSGILRFVQIFKQLKASNKIAEGAT